jgi:hypothetical protein
MKSRSDLKNAEVGLTVYSGPAAHYKQRKNRLYKYKRKSGKYLFAHKIMVNINLAQPTETQAPL